MTKLPASLRAASALAIATAALAMPAPALAGWDRIEQRPKGNTVDQCNNPSLRASDNRALRVAAGADIDIEVLGHGIDLVRDADFEFTGGRVSILRRYSGLENVSRKCGAIGSVKLRLQVNRASPEIGAPAARNYTLRIGDERIAITALLPSVMTDFVWHHASYRSGNQPLSPNPFAGAGSGGNNAAPPSSPPPSSQGPITVQSGQSCPNNVCSGGGTSGFIMPGGGPTGDRTDTDAEPFKSLKGCILGRGGDIRLVGRRLEIMLPDDRNAVRSCITKPVFATTGQFYDRPDIPDIAGYNQQIPRLRFSVRGGTGAMAAASLDPERAKFWLTEDFATRMIGVQNFQLAVTNFASRTQILDVRVQSVVPYGVTRIAPATSLVRPARPGAPDLSRREPVKIVPNVSFDVDLAATDATARPLEWRVLDMARQPLTSSDAQCFSATSGRLTPAAGTSRVTLNVQRASAATWAGRRFVIDIAPQGQLDNPRYVQAAGFTLS